jgi:hypothetical protein
MVQDFRGVGRIQTSGLDSLQRPGLVRDVEDVKGERISVACSENINGIVELSEIASQRSSAIERRATGRWQCRGSHRTRPSCLWANEVVAAWSTENVEVKVTVENGANGRGDVDDDGEKWNQE